MADPPPDVTCRGLGKTFAGPAGPLEVVTPLTLDLAAGKTTAIVGASGCGKSTFLRMIAGLEPPSTGEVLIGGDAPQAVARRAGLAVGFQDPSLLPWRTVRGNIALALRLARLPADPEGVEEMISLVGLDGFGDTRPSALSGGMRQRAAIARCLISRPGLLLLDEPFGAVDELTRARLAADLPRLWEARGTTTVFVTHAVSEAVLIADRVLVMSPRPAQILGDIPIDLPRPRPEGIDATPEFRRLAAHVADALAQGAALRDTPLAAQ